MKKTIKDLIKMFEIAKQQKKKIGVSIKNLPGLECSEIVVNEFSDLDAKLKYYLKNYDENLHHKKDNKIYINNVMVIDCK